MFFIAGISSKVKEVGTAAIRRCPVCGRGAMMHVCVKYNTPHIFFIPTFRFGTAYLATCPHCASVMEMSAEKGKELERNGEMNLEEYDLHTVQDNSRPTCPHCGSAATPGHRFCGHCGGQL